MTDTVINLRDAAYLLNCDQGEVRYMVEHNEIQGKFKKGEKRNTYKIWKYPLYAMLGITEEKAKEILNARDKAIEQKKSLAGTSDNVTSDS